MYEQKMRAVVLAGGPGANMRPLSEGVPKVLLRVAGKPILEYPLRSLIDLGVNDVVVVVSDKAVKDYVEERWGGMLSVSVVYQRGRGIEGALVTGIEEAGVRDVVMVVYGDVITSVEAYRVVLNSYASMAVDGVILSVPLGETETYGVVMSEGGLLKRIIEKPTSPQESSLAFGGISVMPRDVVDLLESGWDLTSALNKLAEERKILAALWSGFWIDVGFPWDILRANYYVLKELKASRISSKASIASTAVIEGPVVIEEGAIVDHYAVIKGPAYIARGSLVGMGSFIREYTSLEEDSVAGSRSEIKRSSLQPRASVGSYSYIADTVIGYEASVSPGVVTLNVLPRGVKISRVTPVRIRGKEISKLGGIIGTRARVGANTVIYPGAVVRAGLWIPPLSVVEREELHYSLS